MLCVCLHLQPRQPQAHKYQQMPSSPSITNIYTDADANGVRIRIEGEGDLLRGHLTALVRSAAEEETPGANTDSEGSETSDGGRPAAMPIDLGFGHFMMNLQTGVTQWCPSGTVQPDAWADWVVMNDPSISADPVQGQAGAEHHRRSNNNDHITAVNAPLSPLKIQGSADATNTDHGMGMEGEMDSSGTGSVEESIMEVCMDQTAATDSACSQ